MGRRLTPILDARPRAAFLEGHAPGAAHLPLDQWDPRAAELPPRDDAFEVVGADALESAAFAARLVERGFARARAAADPVIADRAERGPARQALWRPSGWMIACADRLPTQGFALDLACGSGRHAVWLAARGIASWGIDLLPDAIARARALAAAAAALDPSAALRPRAAIAFAVADATLPLPFRPGAFDLVCGFRYLDRELFGRLANHVAPGGSLVWETFTTEQAQLGRPRRPEFLLAPGELARLCADAGFDVLAARETSPPAGPALASVLARRGRSR